MKTPAHFARILLPLLFLAGCASGPAVRARAPAAAVVPAANGAAESAQAKAAAAEKVAKLKTFLASSHERKDDSTKEMKDDLILELVPIAADALAWAFANIVADVTAAHDTRGNPPDLWVPPSTNSDGTSKGAPAPPAGIPATSPVAAPAP